MKRQFFILPCLLFSFSAIGQHISTSSFGEGLGGIKTCLEGPAAAMGNISGISSEKSKMVQLGSSIPFGFYEAMSNQANLILPLRKGISLAKFTRFGNQYFNINTLSAGFAHKIDQVSLGITANCHRFAIPENLNSIAVSLDFGGQTKIYKNLLFGAQVTNFSLSRFSRTVKNRLDTEIAMGLRWKVFDNLNLYSELGKTSGFSTQTKIGVDYKLSKIIFLRTGISTNPNRLHAGTTLKYGPYTFDYAVINHPTLGLSHFLTIGYTFHEKLN